LVQNRFGYPLIACNEVVARMKLPLASVMMLASPSTAANTNPIAKVLELMDSLKTKVVAEGEAEDKAFGEYFEWCDNAAANTKFAIKTATAEQAKLEAVIAKSVADVTTATTQIEDLAGSISTAEAEVSDATTIREKEHADFAAAESELVDTVDTLDRAIGMLEREAAKNPAMLQRAVDSSNVRQMLTVLDTVISAASISSVDRSKLMALVQDKSDDDSDDYGAPDAASYKSKSGGIIDILADMKEKAEAELAEARKAEGSASHNFAILKQSLDDQIAADSKDKASAEETVAASTETKAVAEGDLKVAAEDLENGKTNLAAVSGDCMTSASDHETSQRGRKEELEALATARKAIEESTSGAESRQYGFFQVDSEVHGRVDLANLEIVDMVKRLAQKEHSYALNQLASRITAIQRYGASTGADPFAKIKTLVSDMITKLENESAAEADEKAYCDEQMAKTNAKKEELTGDLDKLTTKLDKAASNSARLKEEVAEASQILSALAQTSYEMDKARGDEKTAFAAAKADLEAGIGGIQKALEVLRDYYGGGAASLVQAPSPPTGHSKAGGAGGSIIGMLEVVEGDLTKSLTQITVEEDGAVATYETQTHENALTKTLKQQDVKFKTQEAKSLDKAVAEYNSDGAGLRTTLNAVLEYKKQIDGRCIAKPETYGERTKRREAEISGLKDALQILEENTAFLQHKRKGQHNLRH